MHDHWVEDLAENLGTQMRHVFMFRVKVRVEDGVRVGVGFVIRVHLSDAFLFS